MPRQYSWLALSIVSEEAYEMPHATPFPFGILANHNDRRFQLGVAAAILKIADLVLAGGNTFSLTTLGAALSGLQIGMTHNLLSAIVANAAPETLLRLAFGIYKLTTGLAMFAATAAEEAVLMVGGAKLTFGASAIVTGSVVLLLLVSPSSS